MNTSNTSLSKSKQRTMSVALGAILAVVALFQTSAANSKSNEGAEAISMAEVELLAEIDLLLSEEELSLEEAIYFEEMEEMNEEVKVYNSANELIGEGDPTANPILGKLVNQADYLSEVGSHKYYRIGE